MFGTSPLWPDLNPQSNTPLMTGTNWSSRVPLDDRYKLVIKSLDHRSVLVLKRVPLDDQSVPVIERKSLDD
jgi:hypothetical protein